MKLAKGHFTSTTDAVVDEFGCDIEISGDICSRMICQRESHVPNFRTVSIVCMTCVDLTEAGAFSCVQNMCYAHLSQERLICG